LLEKGADATQTRNDGASPLYVACREGRVDVVRLLLENGDDVDVDGTTTTNDWPLRAACRRDHLEIANLLVRHGADPKKQTLTGKRAHWELDPEKLFAYMGELSRDNKRPRES